MAEQYLDTIEIETSKAGSSRQSRISKTLIISTHINVAALVKKINACKEFSTNSKHHFLETLLTSTISVQK